MSNIKLGWFGFWMFLGITVYSVTNIEPIIVINTECSSIGTEL